MSSGVPNVPCGVERLFFLFPLPKQDTFLMYRVELKDRKICELFSHFSNLFLMYRVELKGLKLNCGSAHWNLVPNVPCGVESEV